MFDPRRHAVRPDLADSRLADLLPDDHAVVDGALEQVIAPVVPIFAHPSGTAERASEALLGERVMVFEDTEGFSWCQLQSDGYVGYIPTAALTPEVAEPTHRVSALRTFVYADPDYKSGVSAALFMGSEVTVQATDPEGCAQIGEGEWVFGGHLAALDAREADPVDVAERFLATPYLWGGRSSLGLDCSALVQRAFAACGKVLPRDSDLQESEPVDWLEDVPGTDWQDAAQRGDLLFWPGHVAMVCANDALIHASAHAMAVVREPLAEAVARIEAAGMGGPRLIRRPRLGEGA